MQFVLIFQRNNNMRKKCDLEFRHNAYIYNLKNINVHTDIYIAALFLFSSFHTVVIEPQQSRVSRGVGKIVSSLDAYCSSEQLFPKMGLIKNVWF